MVIPWKELMRGIHPRKPSAPSTHPRQPDTPIGRVAAIAVPWRSATSEAGPYPLRGRTVTPLPAGEREHRGWRQPAGPARCHAPAPARLGLRLRPCPGALLRRRAALRRVALARRRCLLRGGLALRRAARCAVLDLRGQRTQIRRHLLHALRTRAVRPAGCVGDAPRHALAQASRTQRLEEIVPP